MKLDDQARRLLGHLWAGGNYAVYYWRSEFRTSAWFTAERLIDLSADVNVYFGVHPVHQARGKHRRSTIAGIAAINCLFAEWDASQYGDLAAALAHVNSLSIPPTVLVCSGGGYHGYWLLTEPERVTDANRDELRRLQARWVALVGGDPGAKDLARVLRVPGSLNGKYTPPRAVEFVWYDEDYFVLDCLRTHVETFGPPDRPAPALTPPPDLPSGTPPEAGPVNDVRASAYGHAALGAELLALQRARNGERNEQLNKSAFSLGGLVAGGLLQQCEVVSGLYYTALALGTDASFTEQDIQKTINSGFTAGLQQPRGRPNAGAEN